MPLQEAITGSTGTGGSAPFGLSSVYLEAISVANITPPTTPTTFVWPTVVTDNNSIYNSTTGVITVPATGNYVFTLQLYVNGTNPSSRSLYGFVEYSVNSGTTWLPLDNSGRVAIIDSTTPETLSYTVNRVFLQGVQIRIRFYASDANVRLTSITLPSTTVVVPSSRLTLTTA